MRQVSPVARNLLLIARLAAAERPTRRCAIGESGIRTHGAREGSTVFKTVAFNRSAISPGLRLGRGDELDPRCSLRVADAQDSLFAERACVSLLVVVCGADRRDWP
jgi:hypothetical protein